VRRQRPRSLDRSGDDPGVGKGRRADQGVDDTGDVLVGHRCGEQRQPAGAEEWPQLIERRGERGRPGRVVRAVEEDVPAVDAEQLEPAGPANVGVPASAGRVGNVGDPGRGKRIQDGVGDGHVRGLVAAAQPDPRLSEARQLHDQSVAIDGDDRRRIDDRERDPEASRPPADDRACIPDGPGHGEVATFDDRGLLAGDMSDGRPEPVGVVEIDVGDRGHAAVPGVGRIEPPTEPDLDEREVDPLLGEPAKDDSGQELELGWVAKTPGQPIRGRDRVIHQASERGRVDGSTGDLQSLSIRDEMWLGGLADAQAGGPQRGTAKGQDAALAVRAGDEGAAQGPLRAQFQGSVGLNQWKTSETSPIAGTATLKDAGMAELAVLLHTTNLPVTGTLNGSAQVNGTIAAPTAANAVPPRNERRLASGREPPAFNAAPLCRVSFSLSRSMISSPVAACLEAVLISIGLLWRRKLSRMERGLQTSALSEQPRTERLARLRAGRGVSGQVGNHAKGGTRDLRRSCRLGRLLREPRSAGSLRARLPG
jgi:hypothetical protein